MKIKNMLIGGAIASSALVAGTATADVAAWDFSGFSVAGESVSVPLPADVTTGAAGGTLAVLSGTVTAAAQPPGADTSDALGIQAGIYGGDQLGGDTAEALLEPGAGALNAPGAEYLGITTQGSATIRVALTGVGPANQTRVSFGGVANRDAASAPGSDTTTVSVSGGPCGSESLITTVELSGEESETVVWLGAGSACAQLDLDGSGNEPVLDNIAITNVPEPGMAVGLGAGLMGLLGFARRRAA